MIYFIADTHLNHANIIYSSNRPFSDVDEMTETLVENWNRDVTNSDTVFHLGDYGLSYGKASIETLANTFARLNGQKILIKGNHDRKEVVRLPWQAVYDYREIKPIIDGKKQLIVLCHYALRTWRNQHRGSWMLHGHSHGNLTDIGGKIKDVGVDCNGFSPVSLDQIKAFMEKREFIPVDHHVHSRESLPDNESSEDSLEL